MAWRREVVYPSEVVIWTPDRRRLQYRPDCIWTWGREKLHMLIWEVESFPSVKSVAGDVALAAASASTAAEVYAYEHPMGVHFREQIAITDTYNRRLRERYLKPGDYVRLPQPETLRFLLVCRDSWNAQYYSRYLEALAGRSPRPFTYFDTIYCDWASTGQVVRSLRRSVTVLKAAGLA
jgi:hypothetical protein